MQTQTQTVVQRTIWLEGGESQTQQVQQSQPVAKKPRRSVQWTEETVDNEFLNRKKSNICCIYHKPHDKESESSATCTSDDDTNHLERDRTTKQRHKQKCSKSKKPKPECKHIQQ